MTGAGDTNTSEEWRNGGMEMCSSTLFISLTILKFQFKCVLLFLGSNGGMVLFFEDVWGIFDL